MVGYDEWWAASCTNRAGDAMAKTTVDDNSIEDQLFVSVSIFVKFVYIYPSIHKHRHIFAHLYIHKYFSIRAFELWFFQIGRASCRERVCQYV